MVGNLETYPELLFVLLPLGSERISVRVGQDTGVGPSAGGQRHSRGLEPLLVERLLEVLLVLAGSLVAPVELRLQVCDLGLGFDGLLCDVLHRGAILRGDFRVASHHDVLRDNAIPHDALLANVV